MENALYAEIDRLMKINAELVNAASNLLADVRRLYPGEELRCPFMIALDNAIKKSESRWQVVVKGSGCVGPDPPLKGGSMNDQEILDALNKGKTLIVKIVRAVNSHEELLKAAKRLAALEHEDGGRSFPTKEDCAFAREAIKKAEKP